MKYVELLEEYLGHLEAKEHPDVEFILDELWEKIMGVPVVW